VTAALLIVFASIASAQAVPVSGRVFDSWVRLVGLASSASQGAVTASQLANAAVLHLHPAVPRTVRLGIHVSF
jgi:hypothetical protein